jgi:hypothetical protein
LHATALTVPPPYRLAFSFDDGSSGVVDCRPWLCERDDGVFAPLRDPAAFAKVFLNRKFGTIEWPNGADVDPDTLYEEAHRSAVG